ncbi:hypothetical protein, partial [Alteromonas flava]|uniref:hypothetical protein n=1 Tax=Alteromonas flava TaxID=2048003 RepID=UPI000C28B9B3
LGAMSATKRFLYLLEFFAGFAVPVIVLAMGVVFSPIFIVGLFQGAFETSYYLVLVVAGLLGFWGAISLLTLTLHPEKPNTPPKRLKIYIFAGVVAASFVGYLAGQTNWFLLVSFLMTLIVTLHLVFLQRQYLNQ